MLLQHLNAQASLPGIPQLLDEGSGTAVLVPCGHVVGVDKDVRVRELEPGYLYGEREPGPFGTMGDGTGADGLPWRGRNISFLCIKA